MVVERYEHILLGQFRREIGDELENHQKLLFPGQDE
jgi:hypothetical protein